MFSRSRKQALVFVIGYLVLTAIGVAQWGIIWSPSLPVYFDDDRYPSRLWFDEDGHLITIGLEDNGIFVTKGGFTPADRTLSFIQLEGGPATTDVPYDVSIDGWTAAWVFGKTLYVSDLNEAATNNNPTKYPIQATDPVRHLSLVRDRELGRSVAVLIFEDGALRLFDYLNRDDLGGSKLSGPWPFLFKSPRHLMAGSLEVGDAAILELVASQHTSKYYTWNFPGARVGCIDGEGNPFFGTDKGFLWERRGDGTWKSARLVSGAIGALAWDPAGGIFVGSESREKEPGTVYRSTPGTPTFIAEVEDGVRLLAATDRYAAFSTQSGPTGFVDLESTRGVRPWVLNPLAWIAWLLPLAGMIAKLWNSGAVNGGSRGDTGTVPSGGTAAPTGVEPPPRSGHATGTEPPNATEKEAVALRPLAVPTSGPPNIRDSAGQELSAGTMLGRHQIVSQLGRGATGTVYRAADTELGREVALKVLRKRPGANDNAVARFIRETRLVANLSHPNIVRIYDVQSTPDLVYAVMELLEGSTLATRIAQERLSQAEALSIARQLACGLSAAHAKQIVHRDIKPTNIFLTRSDGVKLLDFGLAFEWDNSISPDHETPTRLTTEGAFVGTPAYASPEQLLGYQADFKTDIFSFGCVFFEMLAGKVLFARNPGVGTTAGMLNQQPDLRGLPDRVSPRLASMIRKCVQRDPADRFSSMTEVIHAIDDEVAEATSSNPDE